MIHQIICIVSVIVWIKFGKITSYYIYFNSLYFGMKGAKNNAKPYDIRMFDIYSKVDEDFRVQTAGGGWLSICGWIITALLVMSELSQFFAVEYKEHMIVDTTLNQKLKINVDMTFHSLTCADVHLDAMDVAGDNQLNIESEMYKQRITSEGRPIGEKGVEILGNMLLRLGPTTSYAYHVLDAQVMYQKKISGSLQQPPMAASLALAPKLPSGRAATLAMT
jgi:hypothetical protein